MVQKEKNWEEKKLERSGVYKEEDGSKDSATFSGDHPALHEIPQSFLTIDLSDQDQELSVVHDSYKDISTHPHWFVTSNQRSSWNLKPLDINLYPEFFMLHLLKAADTNFYYQGTQM